MALVGAVLVVAIRLGTPPSPSRHAPATTSSTNSSAPAGQTAPTVPSAGGLPYASSYVGNTFSGAADQWVQPGVQGLAVAGDGTAYDEMVYSEEARELRGYRNGSVFGSYTFQHEDLPNGGLAVAVDDSFVYAAVRLGNSAGVMRYHRDLSLAPFAGGSGDKGSMLVVNSSYEYLTALAVSRGRLYVADPRSFDSRTSQTPAEQTVVKVYDTGSLSASPLLTFAAPRARALAVDGTGSLWVLEQGDGSNPAMVRRFSPQGVPESQEITSVADPVAIAVDTSAGGAGRLLVADDGPDQDIKIFTGLDSGPEPAGTFGVKGGVLAGPVRGRVGPLRFNGPKGIGVDGAGNIYVANNGDASFAVEGYGQGMSLEAYRPNGTLLWQDYAQKYSTMSTLDPATGTDVYNTFDHYKLDLSRPPGQQWVRVGWTLDPQRYPNDPRINDQGQGPLPTVPVVRTLDGHKFLFMANGTDGDSLNIFRFDGKDETAIPSGSINDFQAKASPGPGEFIWRDVNGDGSPYGNVAAEYSSPGTGKDAPSVTGWWVDDSGDVWQTTETGGIRRFRFQGLDAVGNPKYSYGAMDTFAMPAPFTRLRRLEYDRAHDVMYLMGYTADQPYPPWDDSKFAGRVIGEIDHFAAGNRTLAHQTVVPYAWDPSDAAPKPMAFSVAGSYLFVGYFSRAGSADQQVQVYDATTGHLVVNLLPGPEVGGHGGGIDMQEGVSADKLPNGEYVIFAEDDGWAKTIMYEWSPKR